MAVNFFIKKLLLEYKYICLLQPDNLESQVYKLYKSIWCYGVYQKLLIGFLSYVI